MMSLMASSWNDEKRKQLDTEIAINFGNICQIKPMALTLSTTTQLEDAHVIFTMLRCDHCYITDQGRLTGVLTTNHMIEANKKRV